MDKKPAMSISPQARILASSRRACAEITRVCTCSVVRADKHGVCTMQFFEYKDRDKLIAEADKRLKPDFRLIRVTPSVICYQQWFESLSLSSPHKELLVETQIALEAEVRKNLSRPEQEKREESFFSGDTFSAREVANFMSAAAAGLDVRVDRRVWDNTFRRR